MSKTRKKTTSTNSSSRTTNTAQNDIEGIKKIFHQFLGTAEIETKNSIIKALGFSLCFKKRIETRDFKTMSNDDVEHNNKKAKTLIEKCLAEAEDNLVASANITFRDTLRTIPRELLFGSYKTHFHLMAKGLIWLCFLGIVILLIDGFDRYVLIYTQFRIDSINKFIILIVTMLITIFLSRK